MLVRVAQGKPVSLAQLSDAPPEQFLTYRAFKCEKKCTAFILRIGGKLQSFRKATYGGTQYYIVRYMYWSPRGKIHYSRKPKLSRQKVIVAFRYNEDGSLKYVANKYAVVKIS